MENKPKSVLSLAYFAMVCVPILFGSYYIVTKIVNETIPIFWMVGFRMLFAVVGFLPFANHLHKTTLKAVLVSSILGFIFFMGVIAQAEGLKSIDAGKAAFISGLFVILTPLISWLLYGTKIPPLMFIPILITLSGTFVMFYNPATNFLMLGRGELLNFVGAISITLHLVILGKSIKDTDVICIAFYQCLFMLFYSLIGAVIFNQPFPVKDFSIHEWGLLAYLGIATSTLPLILQSWAQKAIKDTIAAMILSLEPLCATLFGVIFGKEQLTWFNCIGGMIIMIGFIFTILQRSKFLIISEEL